MVLGVGGSSPLAHPIESAGQKACAAERTSSPVPRCPISGASWESTIDCLAPLRSFHREVGRAHLRLIKLKLTDFRRFVGEQSLDLNEAVIALVGPNEAGKSSILSAIESVGRKAPPEETDTARGGTGPAIVAALFALDTDDRTALAATGGGEVVTRVWVTRTAGQKRPTWSLEPHPKRDLTPRRSVWATFKLFLQREVIPRGLAEVVMKALASSAETLPSGVIRTLEAIEKDLPDVNDKIQSESGETRQLIREDRVMLANELAKLIEIEKRQTPWQQVVNVLNNRIPDIVFFGGPDRELQGSYRIDEVSTNTPAGLRNICALAELDLKTVGTEIANGRMGRVERLMEEANAKLRNKFRGTWRQSPVHPRLSGALDGVLRVFVATEDGDYTFPEERSDGLRWFMALQAFLAAHGQHDPILLVDEAETHLHYDAQADLIDAFMNQRIARQVIYTTHSVGCLPPDLGCGIRVVLAEEGTERSRLANSYWSVQPASDEKFGYTPLLFAMGAQLLPLTIPRFGVVVEGPADAILLPSLLREVTGLNALPYRIVPGLSEISKSKAGLLSYQGGKVVSLADGDAGGLDIGKKLRDSGIPDQSIFDLGQVRSACTLEDLVDADILAGAINQEMDTWGIDPLRVVAADLPLAGRWAWLVQKGMGTGTPTERLSKARVAQRVVDVGQRSRGAGEPRVLVNEIDITKLRELHIRMCEELGVPTGE